VSGRHSRPAAGARHGRAVAAPTSPSRASPVAFAPGARSIFRAQALASHAGGAEPADADIRLGEPWLRWLYLLVLALVAAGIALLLTVRTAEENYGTAVVSEPGGYFAALLPVAAIPDIGVGHAVAAELSGPTARKVSITGARVQLASASLARRAGLAPPAQPSVLLTGRVAANALPRPARGRTMTPVALVVTSEPLGSIVAEEFEVMLGTRQAGT
jgi:hypothetical protein